jgi:nicotinic acid phosphoribosyltransferase
MMQAYVDEGLEQEAVFGLFVRRLPPHRNYLIACGLDDVLRFLETLAFDDAAFARSVLARRWVSPATSRYGRKY